MKKRGKRAQMKLSFGVIFSIILIVVFLFFGFYVIGKFIDTKNSIEIGRFTDGLQTDVDKMWKSSQGSQEAEYSLPKKIKKLCFVDYFSSGIGADAEFYKELRQFYYEDENLFFYPVGSGGGLDSKKIQKIDIKKITQDENPFCIKNDDGKIQMIIKKDFDSGLVEIKR